MQIWYFLGFAMKTYSMLNLIERIFPTISFLKFSVILSSILTVMFRALSTYFSATSDEI